MKSSLNTLLASVFLTSALLLLSSCQSVDIRGQYVEAESIEKINNSKLSQREIKDLIGTPTYIPEYSPDTWYYIQRSMSRRAWFDPKVVEQKIIKITFDSNHIATHAELITNSQKESIVLHNDFTKSNGTEKNGLQKFVGNIGKFNKTTNGKKNKQKR